MTKSKQKRSNTRQKRASRPLGLELLHIQLKDSFPFIGHGNPYRPPDTTIERLHVHPQGCLEIGYCFKGSGIFAVEDRLLPYGAGDISIMNDAVMHVAHGSPGEDTQWTFFFFDPRRLVGESSGDIGWLDVSPLCGPKFPCLLKPGMEPGVEQLVQEILAEISRKPNGWRTAVRGLVWSLMVRLHRLAGTGRKSIRKRNEGGMQKLAPALAYLSEHYAEPVRIGNLAQHCGYSEAHVRRLFREVLGCSPQQQLNRVRIHMGAALLDSTDRSILQISLDVGFPSLTSFNRGFKFLMRKTPREWRKRKRSVPKE